MWWEFVDANASRVHIEKHYYPIERIKPFSSIEQLNPSSTARPRLSSRVGGIGRQAFTISFEHDSIMM